MNREAIKATAVCFYDAENNEFVVKSPLLDPCIGVGDSEEEARQEFEAFVESMYVAYLEGKVVGQYAKRGRPAKNRTNINIQVKPETAENLKAMAATMDISQGESIDYLYAFWEAAHSMPSVALVEAKSSNPEKDKSTRFFAGKRKNQTPSYADLPSAPVARVAESEPDKPVK